MLGFVCPMTLYHTGKEGERWTGFHDNAVMHARRGVQAIPFFAEEGDTECDDKAIYCGDLQAA
jgi:hypothetical protein